MKILFFLLFLPFLFSCTRELGLSGETSKVSIQLPSKALSSKIETLTINPTRTFGWGRDNITSLSEVDCYVLMVEYPEKEKNNSCSTEAGAIPLHPHISYGLIPAGGQIELELDSGANRKLTLLGLSKDPAKNCVDFRSPDFSRNDFSAPIVLAEASKDLPKGESVTVEMTMSVASSSNIQLCKGPEFSNHWFVPALSPEQSVVTVASSIVGSGTSTVVTLIAKDSLNGSVTSGGEPVVFSFSGGTSTGTFSSVTDNLDGTYTATFTGAAAGTATTVHATIDSKNVTSFLPAITVIPGAMSPTNSIVQISSSSVRANESITANIQTRDAYGNSLVTGGATVAFSLSGGTSTGVFGIISDLANGTYSATLTGQIAGTASTVAATVNSTNVTLNLPIVSVLPGSPRQTTLSGPTIVEDADCSASSYVLTLKDFYANNTSAETNLSLNLSGGNAKFYSDSSCLNEILTLNMNPGDSSASFYIKDLHTEMTALTASSAANSITGSPFAISIVPSTAHLGGTLSPQWETLTSSAFAAGYGDGMLYSPAGITHDSSGNMYIYEAGHNRISKYSSTGTYLGWIGTVKVSPTSGAAGCAGAAPTSITPGWCFGGVAGSSSTPGDLADTPNPIGLTLANDGTYLYVPKGSRVQRYLMSTGAFSGWIGKISASPTGGDSGCNGATVGTVTSGWCFGGNSTNGTGDGMFSTTTTGVWVQNGFLYVVDSVASRLQRFNLTTKQFAGWIGKIATSPSAGDPGCNGASVGTITPGWCVGGTSTAEASTTASAGFYSPFSITGDGTYLYIGASGRILRYHENGTYSGWIGWISGTAPTSPGSCLITNNVTPTWCYGGLFNANSSGQGGMGPVIAVQTDGTSLFILDRGYNRILKYSNAGSYQGWIGRAASAPTGGAPGCLGLSVLSSTPGWCLGGITYMGSQLGAFNFKNFYSGGLSIFGGSLYISDSGNQRIVKLDPNSGSQTGLIGATLTSENKWSKNTVLGSPESSAEFSFSKDSLNPQAGILVTNTEIIATDNTYNSLKKFDLFSGQFLGWRGLVDQTSTTCPGSTYNQANPAFCLGGGPLASGNNIIGGFPGVSGIGEDSNYYYTLDMDYGRIQRFDKTTHAFAGWIGKISATTPTLTGACSGQSSSQMTNGWCFGGSAQNGSLIDELQQPRGLLVHNGFIYVANNPGRVHRFNASTGIYMGWIGKIGATAPSGGDAGCTSTISSPTPGWCVGGTSTAGLTNGEFTQGFSGLAADSNYLYVADQGRVARYNLPNGVFAGWIGKISATTPTLSAGCTSQSPNQTTNGWCLGGTTASATIFAPEGSLAKPSGITVDANFLYVVDSDASRNIVLRYNLITGAYTGWKGTIASSAGLSGGIGCSSASVGQFTPNWCTGGLPGPAQNGSIGFIQPTAIKASGEYLYILDSGNGRIVRVPK